jgi:DNA-binding PadR family transcriptional regulator
VKKKQQLLADPAVSTFYRKTLEQGPEELEQLCQSIGVQRQRAKNWMQELEDEGLVSVERKEDRLVVQIGEENVEALNSFASDLQDDFSSELRKWDERLSQAANELVRMKDVVDDDDVRQDFDEKLAELKDSSEDIDIEALKSLSDVESFLGHGEIAREELHVFHRKFKVLDRIRGF